MPVEDATVGHTITDTKISLRKYETNCLKMSTKMRLICLTTRTRPLRDLSTNISFLDFGTEAKNVERMT